MTPLLRYLGTLLFTAGVATIAAAAPVRTEHVEAELVPAATALQPGGQLTVALRLKMDRGWHTYWQNPGDSGLPTTLDWKLPPGLAAGPLQWPPPRALPVGPLVNYGYEGEVLLLTDIAVAPAFSSAGPTTLNLRADWLVCKEICIPEGADLALRLPVAANPAPDARWGDAIAQARAALPQPLAGWSVTATGHGQQIELALAPASNEDDPGELRLFPLSEGKIEAGKPQTLARDGTTLKLTLPVASQRVGDFARLAGVLTASHGFRQGRAVRVDAPLEGSIIAGTPPDVASAVTTAAVSAATPGLPLQANGAAEGAAALAAALAFAFVGGLLLNLMPCVFPVLSLKVLGFAMHGGDVGAMRRHGVAFAGGVVVSFWLLAGLLLALRATGQQLGWGFQLQSPAVVVGLAILFFVLALNLSGVFEIGPVLPSAISGWNARNAYVNDVLSGALAVIVASPCSAPFMGAAIGWALTATPVTTIAVFTALGVGMALPYLLLACFPAWRARLPRPGAWMVRLKQLLAFPLYATVIWLAWVLGAQLDNDAVARLLLVLLLLAFALWAWQTMRAGATRAWGWAALASVAGIIVVGWPVVSAVAGGEPPAKQLATERGPWQDYAPDRLQQLTAAGRAVFVDFTAAWCVTCQVNKRLVLNTDAVQQAFAQNNVVLLRADWTRRDATIGRALAALGRSGLPVYVLYRPGREPLLLPEILHQRMITDALTQP